MYDERNDCVDVYGLLTELCKHTLQTYRPIQENFYTNHECDNKIIKHLRSKAFGILLNKIDEPACTREWTKNIETDPVLEISRHAFVLKVGFNRTSEANTLDGALEKLGEDAVTDTRVRSTLQLLTQLKSFKQDPKPITNIFHYGEANSMMSEILYSNDDTPLFQIRPIDAVTLSDGFRATLEAQKSVLGIECIGGSIISGFISNHTFNETPNCTAISPYQYFMGNIDTGVDCLPEIRYPSQTCSENDENENVSLPEQGFTNCLDVAGIREALRTDSSSIFCTWKTSDDSLSGKSDASQCVWDRFDIDIDASVLNLRTWEFLGQTRLVKELPFITDLPNAAVHLTKIKRTSNLLLLSDSIINSIDDYVLREVPAKEFISDVKSMLLGVESNCFEHKDTVGFDLRKNISVLGIGTESMEAICQEPIAWANSLKCLSRLVTPDPQSGKLPQEGLIFKAMCTNIKELLLYYRASLLRIFTTKDESGGLLKLIQKVRPVAILVVEVAKLCEPYQKRQYVTSEGNSILTRIYKEVIRVTNAKVALVFYSILKSCCEVYFRYLQKWMFEGLCDDTYGEFMIKTHSQYLRNRGHKFWTKSFSISHEAVPGFLSGLTESILQCGKTVRLLRICDSKNPVCRLFVTEQPEVRVCLSINMLHEQLTRCQEYEKRGKDALGRILSVSSAIQERKQIEKETAELVVRSQNKTMSRIVGERKELLQEIARNKQKLLASLKEDAEKSDLQKKKEKEDQIRSDRIFLEGLDREERVTAQAAQEIERANLLTYYKQLACDIDKRRMRSQWRRKRMNLYEERIDALTATREDSPTANEPDVIRTAREVKSNEITAPSYEDENRNFARTAYEPLVDYHPNNPVQAVENSAYRETADRDLTRITTVINSNESTLRSVASETEMQDILKNRSVDNLQQTIVRPVFLSLNEVDNTRKLLRDYGMTPNNNEFKLLNSNEQTTRQTADSEKSTQESIRDAKDLITENDLETPMSCTTDNFPSSMVSSVSQTQNPDDQSPANTTTSSGDASISSGILKSYLPVTNSRTFPDLFDPSPADKEKPLSSTSPLTVADVEIIDHTSLQAYLEKSIVIPLRIQSRLVNNAIIKYFLREHDLLLHLHSLRSYFFLLNGEFARSLTDSLYTRLYEISMPIELFNSATLTNLLERALINSFSNVYIKSGHLSLSAIDTPNQLHISDPNALDCLYLNYKISWPLNIILDDTVMLHYGKVFKFLITSGRVSWVLQQDFYIMKREQKAATSEQYHKLQLYRHSMMQFMNALHNYLTCSVLHASWAEFEKDLQNSLTLDQIYLSHVNYVKRILSRCMLNVRSEKMRVCLNNIFKVILKFHNRLRLQSWIGKSTGYVHPNFKSLEQMYRAFCELRAYMAHVAHKLATSGYQPHLMHFLNALNINYQYDLTVKTSRSSVAATEL